MHFRKLCTIAEPNLLYKKLKKMKIDLGTAIIGSIVILICVIPFVVIHFKKLKKENKILQRLNDFANQNQGKISHHEFCGDFVLGIDESKKFAFFLKFQKEESVPEFVDLSEIEKCKILQKTKSVNGNSGNFEHTEQLNLGFIKKNRDNLDQKFELYDEEINRELTGEIQFAEKWVVKINDLLQNN